MKNLLTAFSLIVLVVGVAGCPDDQPEMPPIALDIAAQPPNVEVVVIQPSPPFDRFLSEDAERVRVPAPAPNPPPVAESTNGVRAFSQGPLANPFNRGPLKAKLNRSDLSFSPARHYFLEQAASARTAPPSGLPSFPGDLDQVDDAAFSPEDNPCSCQADACMVEWIEENMGCNVCAVFMCSDERHPHACNLC